MGEETFFEKLTKDHKKEISHGTAHKASVTQTDKSNHKQNEKSKKWMTEPEGQLALDVYQTEKDIIIKSTIAGVRSQDLDISLTNDMLSIKGARQQNNSVKAEDYYYRECYWGAFSRSVILPMDVDADNIQASLKNGILTVTLPKMEKITTKQISVQE